MFRCIMGSALAVMANTQTDAPPVYYWRVIARDAVHDLSSPWSPIDSFIGSMIDPYQG